MPGEGSSFDVPPAAYGRYRVLHQIGAGSMGPVFRGEVPETREPVAIKVFRLNLPPEVAGRLADRLRALADRVPTHPALARVIDAGVQHVEPYLVSSLASGDSLDVALREFGPAVIADAVPRFRALAEAMDLAAAAGVWHGALQPRDILISAEETVMVGLGVAPALEALGIRIGTRRPYIAPEVLAGGKSSPRSDQFSFAAIAYEWMFGRRIAGPAETPLELPAVAGVNDEALSAALTSALAPNPHDRFDSMGALVDAIADAAQASPEPRTAERAAPAVVNARTPSPSPNLFDAADDLTDEDSSGPSLLDDDRVIEIEPADAIADLSISDQPQPLRFWVADEPESPPSRGVSGARYGEVSPELAYNSARAEADAPAAESHESPESEDQPVTTWQSAADDPQTESASFGPIAMAIAVVIALGIGGVGGYVVGRSVGETPNPGTPATTAPVAGKEYTDAPLPTSASPAPPEAMVGKPIDSQARSGAQPAQGDARGGAQPRQSGEAAAAGRMLIRSTPAGATVSVDGTVRGITPLALRDLAIGTHAVVLSRPGFVPVERRVVLSSDRPSRTVEERLASASVAATSASARAATTTSLGETAPKRPRSADGRDVGAGPGALLIESRPAGATVRVDGRSVGTTPLTVNMLTAGTYTVRLERPGYRPWTTTVEISAGEKARVAASLVGGQAQE